MFEGYTPQMPVPYAIRDWLDGQQRDISSLVNAPLCVAVHQYARPVIPDDYSEMRPTKGITLTINAATMLCIHSSLEFRVARNFLPRIPLYPGPVA